MDWLRDHAWETWLGLAIVLGVAEMFSLDLVLACSRPVPWSAWSPPSSVCRSSCRSSPRGRVGGAAGLVRPAMVKRLHTVPSSRSATASWSATAARHPGDHRPGAGPHQAGRRVWSAAALRRAPTSIAAGRDRRDLPDQGRDRLRPPGGHGSSPDPASTPPHDRTTASHAPRRSGEPMGISAGPAPARRPVRRRPARQDGTHRAPGTRRHRRALRQVQGDAARRTQHRHPVHRPAALPHRPARAGRVASRRSR